MAELRKDLFADIADEPREHYTFRFSAEEARRVANTTVSSLARRMFLTIVLCAVIVLVGAVQGSDGICGWGAGTLLIGLAGYIKSIHITKKANAVGIPHVAASVYDYTVFGGYAVIWVCNENTVLQVRVTPADIQKSRIVAGLVVLQIRGRLYLLRKNELAEGSFFLRGVTKERK